MTSVMRLFTILLVWYVLLGYITSEAAGPSGNVLTVLTLLNGNYSNKAEFEQEHGDVDYIEVRFIPVDVVSLRPAPSLYFEETLNGIVVRVHVSTVTEEDDGKVLLTHYNVTNRRYYENPPGTVTVSEISSLPLKELQHPDNCVAKLQDSGDGNFFGPWLNCHDKHEHYVLTTRCDHYFVDMPPNAQEREPSLVPYNMVRRGPRYPVPGAPANFTSVCDKTS